MLLLLLLLLPRGQIWSCKPTASQLGPGGRANAKYDLP